MNPHTKALHDPLTELARWAAERMLLALEVQCERDGEAHYESLTARRCGDDHCTLWYEDIGVDRWLRTREQALAYVQAEKIARVKAI